jgi:hypothetical protein
MFSIRTSLLRQCVVTPYAAMTRGPQLAGAESACKQGLSWSDSLIGVSVELSTKIKPHLSPEKWGLYCPFSLVLLD